MAQGGHANFQTASESARIEEDIPFQQREWSVQRVGWLVMFLLVIAALLGLTGGGGPLATASQHTPDDTLHVHYSRVQRSLAPAQLELTLASGGGDELEVWIGNEFLSEIEIESISPQPLETRAGPDRQVFVFAVADGAREFEVTVHYRPQVAGISSGSAGIVGGQELTFDQLVVP